MSGEMKALITLANGKSFSASTENTILSEAVSNDLILEYSCRTGRCGVCKARVISGHSLCLKAETSLTEQEIQDGYILTCCRAASSDLELGVEDLGDLAQCKAKTIPARVDSIHRLASDVVKVVLRTPPSNSLIFRAGQYVDIIGPQGIKRSYSIANSPRQDGKLVFEIRKVDGGILSEYWFTHASLNDLVRLEGPLGTFCLRSKPVDTLIFLATGTGIAPIKAMLEELAERYETAGVGYKKIYLYWGGRKREDIYWTPEFNQLPLKFRPVLSREESWTGRTGYVQTAVLYDQISLNNAAVYACGSEAMIQSAKSTLTSSGLSTQNFYSDAFVSSSYN